MRRDERAAAVDHGAAVGLEGVGRVVEAVAETDPNEQVCQPVHEELHARIVDDLAALDETGAEGAIVAFAEDPPVGDGIARGVGGVGHHDDAGVADHVVEPPDDGAAEAVRAGVLRGRESRDLRLQLLEHFPGAVLGAVVDDDDLVWDAFAGKGLEDVSHGAGEGLLLVAGWDDDGEQGERSGGHGGQIDAEGPESERGGEVEPLGMFLGVRGNLLDDGGDRCLRPPVPDFGGVGGVEHHPGNVEGARLSIRGDGVRAKLLVAPCGELAK